MAKFFPTHMPLLLSLMSFIRVNNSRVLPLDEHANFDKLEATFVWKSCKEVIELTSLELDYDNSSAAYESFSYGQIKIWSIIMTFTLNMSPFLSTL